MTNTNTKATHSNQFENLKSLKSKTIPQIADFCQTLKQARQKLNDIDSAIQKKQNEFEEKFKAVEIAVQEEVVIENEKKETEKEVVSIEENIVKEVAPQVDAVDTVAVSGCGHGEGLYLFPGHAAVGGFDKTARSAAAEDDIRIVGVNGNSLAVSSAHAVAVNADLVGDFHLSEMVAVVV